MATCALVVALQIEFAQKMTQVGCLNFAHIPVAGAKFNLSSPLWLFSAPRQKFPVLQNGVSSVVIFSLGANPFIK
jgi:hypothetical protein